MAKSKRYYDLECVDPEIYAYTPGNHRYSLKFRSKNNLGGRTVAGIQMNGSTANWTEDKSDWNPDSTIGKVLCWCYENKKTPFETVYCLNLWSYVDKDPQNLKGKSNKILNHPYNDDCIRRVCNKVDVIILAHGDCKGVDPYVFIERKKQLLKLLEGKTLYQVGKLTTKGKNPKHGRGWNWNPTLVQFYSERG